MSIVMQKYMISCPSGAICYALVAELKSLTPPWFSSAVEKRAPLYTRGMKKTPRQPMRANPFFMNRKE